MGDLGCQKIWIFIYNQPLRKMNQRLLKDELQRIFFNIYKYWGVILAKKPDIGLSTFTDILPDFWHSKKYLSCARDQNARSGPRAKWSKLSFESRAKTSQSAPHFFNFLSVFRRITMNLQKCLNKWNILSTVGWGRF